VDLLADARDIGIQSFSLGSASSCLNCLAVAILHFPESYVLKSFLKTLPEHSMHREFAVTINFGRGWLLALLPS